MSTVFIAVNGDNVGDSIGSAIADDNHEELSRLSGSINDSHTQIDEWIKTVGGRVISTSGDEGIYQVSSEVVDQLDSIRADYAEQTGHTLTVGIGESVSQASKALLYGKYNSKDQIVHYEPAIEDYINQDESQDGMQPEGELPPEQEIIDNGEAEMEAAQGIPQQEDSVPEHEQEMGVEQNAIHDQQEQTADEMDMDSVEADEEMAMDAPIDEAYANDSIGDAGDEDNAGLETDSVGEETPEEIVDGVAGMEGQASTEGGDEMDGIDGDIDNQDPMQAGAAADEMEADAIDGEQEAEGHEGALTNMIEGHMGEEEEMPMGEEEMPIDEEMGQEAPMEEEIPQEMGEEQIAQDMEAGGDEYQEMEGEEELMPEGEELEEGGDDELKADIADSLMSFKQHKDLLEELQQTRPELYTGTITMLRAMIEMAKRLGFAPNLGDEEMEEEMLPEGEEELPQEGEEEFQEMGEEDISAAEGEEEIDPEEEAIAEEAAEPEMPEANEEEEENKLGK